MKETMTKLCWPILKRFETGQPVTNYKKSYRTILIFVGGLFLFLSSVCGAAAIYADQTGALIPVVVFFGVGLVSLVVGTLGSDGAVASIWGTK
jgi:hypothetical protein